MEINITDIKEVKKLTPYHYQIFIICGLLMFLDGFDLLAISYVAPTLASEFMFSSQQVGFIFSAGVLGSVIGAIVIGMLGDKWGRKPCIIIACALFGLGTLGTVWMTTYSEFLIIRFIAGIGLGGAAPIALAYATDFAPKRLRSSISIIIYSGFILGGLVAGFISVWLSGTYGWTSLFYIGGIATLLLLPLLIWGLPESLEILVAKNKPNKVKEVLVKIAPSSINLNETYQFVIEFQKKSRSGVTTLFSENRALQTLMLWFTFFFTFITIYIYANWMPILLKDMGLTLQQAIMTSAISQIGNLIFSIILARLMLKMSIYKILCISYICGSLAVLSISFIGSNFVLQIIANFFVGGLIASTIAGLYALATTIYPHYIRTTGSGWAIGFGRIGAIIGPIVVGILIANLWTPEQLFQYAALIPLLSGVLCFLLGRLDQKAKADNLTTVAEPNT